MWAKVAFIVLICCYIVCNLDVAMACIKNRDGCQPDGSQGNCCSGFCHKEPGWVAGYCK